MNDQTLSRAADDAVRRLRSKIEVNPSRPEHLLSVHGVGYRFVPLLLATPPAPALLSSPPIALDGLQLDLDRARVLRSEGLPLPLTSIEVAFLRRLLERPDHPNHRNELLRVLWGRAPDRAGRVVENMVLRLREKIEVDPSAPRNLLTQKGAGYLLRLPSEPQDDVPIVGRAREIGAVVEAIGASRWVALVGPPGVGTSRVAAAALHARMARASVPSLRVDLGGAREPSEIVARLARARGRPTTDEDSAGHGLGRSLVLLDDADEALLALRTLIPRWLAASPGSRILVCAREASGVQGERVVPIAPLAPADATALLSRLSPVPLRPDDALALAVVLDGLPLALALAARRLAVVPPRELLVRLENRLSVLATSSPEVPLRRRSLTAAFELSWAAVGRAAERAATRLAVVPGSFDLALAEDLVGAGALDAMERLVAQSLLRVEGDRHRLLAPARLDRLEHGAADALAEAASALRLVCERRARRWLREVEPALLPRCAVEEDLPQWVAVCEAEPPPTAEVFVVAARLTKNRVAEERWLRLVDRGLERSDGEERAILLRLRAMRRLSMSGDRAGALVDISEAAALVPDRAGWLAARIADTLAWALSFAGRHDEAEVIFRDVLSWCRPADASVVWSSLGAFHRRQGRLFEAIAAYETALVEGVVDSDFVPEAAWMNLGIAVAASGDAARAVTLFGIALEAVVPGSLIETNIRHNLCVVLVGLGRLDEAAELYALAEADARSHGWTALLVWVICGRARLLLLQGEGDRALRATDRAPACDGEVLAEVLVHRAACLCAVGRSEEARIVLQQSRRVGSIGPSDLEELRRVVAAMLDGDRAQLAEIAHRPLRPAATLAQGMLAAI